MKKGLIFIAVCLWALGGQASPVDSTTARHAAGSFLSHTLRLKRIVETVDQSALWDYQNLYLFTFSNGFVITSADNAARPILAYSLNGTINPKHLSSALRGILDTYEAEIAMSKHDDLPVDPAWQTLLDGHSLLAGSKDAPEAVGPLVTTQWGQYAPYNDLCPSHVPSGCVATAMSQVMRYWNYPAFGEGSHSYNCATFGNLSADFAHTRYDWVHMPETGGSTTEERTALATLTFHVGVSVNMDYNYTQSGATTGGGDNCALESLRNYFHYNRSSISYHSKNSMSDSAWTDFLMNELRQMRPIMYDGTAGNFGGHSFICDGYDSLRMLHFNLGEFGEGDGFYAVGAIVYMQYNLNGNNSAIIGIQPEYGLYVSDTTLTFHRSGGGQPVWVSASDTCNQPWTATSNHDWITLSNLDFDHLGTITVSLSENPTGQERTGTVFLQQGPFSAHITVRQAAFDEEDFCPLTVYMENTRDQAWSNGAHLSFESPEGLVYATATHSANGQSSTQTVNVAPYNVFVRWHHGGPLDRYYNYTVTNADGDILVNVVNAYYNADDILLAHPCPAPTGIHDPPLSASDHLIYICPNPTTENVKVVSDSPILKIAVHDMFGRQIFAETDTHAALTIPLSCSEWASGLYLIQVTTERGYNIRKMVKK